MANDPGATWFELPVRVYFEDTDAQGIVYFASYLRFMERGRTEWLRSAGIEQQWLMESQGLVFSLIDTHVRFRQAMRLDDALLVRTRVAGWRGARVEFEQQVVSAADPDRLATEGTCIAAALDADTLKPRRLPQELTDLFSHQ